MRPGGPNSPFQKKPNQIRPNQPNRYSALAEYPNPSLRPMRPMLPNIRPNLTILGSIPKAVNPNLSSTKEEEQPQTPEEFDIIRKVEIPILALDKQYENWKVADLLKSCYTNF